MNFLNKGMSFMNSQSGSHSSSNPITLFKQLDSDGNGKITEEDFVAAIHKLGLGSVGDMAVRQAFKQLDKNKNGILDLSEALAAFEKIKSLIAKR